MPLKLITPATEDPVSLAEIRRHLKMDRTPSDDDDPNILIKLGAAVRKLESGTQTARAFIQSTWDLYLDRWPCGICGSCFSNVCCGGYFSGWHANAGYRHHEHSKQILIPKGQLQSVTSIIYTDSAGAATPWPTTEYEVDTASDPGRVVLAYGKHWPSASLKRSNAIVIRFVAGWADAGAVPNDLKAAIMLETEHLYMHTSAVTSGRLALQSMPLARGVDDLVAPYRIRGVQV